MSEAPYEGMAYPASGEAPCGQTEAPDATHDKYTGQFKKITAVDALTVEFQLCSPDVAFLPKVAFSAFGIQDSDYLEAHAADKSSSTSRTARARTSSRHGSKGNRMVFERVRRLLGRPRP